MNDLTKSCYDLYLYSNLREVQTQLLLSLVRIWKAALAAIGRKQKLNVLESYELQVSKKYPICKAYSINDKWLNIYFC